LPIDFLYGRGENIYSSDHIPMAASQYMIDDIQHTKPGGSGAAPISLGIVQIYRFDDNQHLFFDIVVRSRYKVSCTLVSIRGKHGRTHPLLFPQRRP
jgi:hypothetical protein